MNVLSAKRSYLAIFAGILMIIVGGTLPRYRVAGVNDATGRVSQLEYELSQLESNKDPSKIDPDDLKDVTKDLHEAKQDQSIEEVESMSGQRFVVAMVCLGNMAVVFGLFSLLRGGREFDDVPLSIRQIAFLGLLVVFWTLSR